MRLTLSALLFCALVPAQPRAVWIDTDPSVAPGGHEIDDGLALLQSFASKELAIRGVSITFGNADLPAASRIGRYIVQNFGPRGLRVYDGASSATDLDKETDATRALAAALRREHLTILALGPATNIARLLKRHPDLTGRIDEIVAVAGRRPGQQFTAGTSARPLRDFNFEMDPRAFQVLLDSKVKLTFAPWEVSSKVWLTRNDLEPLATKSRGVAWLMPAALDWLTLWANQFGAAGFNPFDTLAVGYLVDPDTITCSQMTMRIETADKPYLVVRDTNEGRVVKYCHTPSPAFKDRLLQRLAGPN
jgi:pyrimidine-specific ribonucleoside hydrolase